MDWHRVGSRAKNLLPSGVTQSLEPLYFRFLARLADHRHVVPESQIEISDSAPDHVLLLTVDANRPDYIPNIDQLDFSTAIAPSTWTFPSVTSYHTGLFPHEHGAVVHAYPDDSGQKVAVPSQCERSPKLPEVLESAGYSTCVITGLLMAFLSVRGWYGRHHLFDQARAETLVEKYTSWRSGQKRSFCYLHLSDLHAPLDPPSEYISDAGVDTSLPQIRWNKEYVDGPPYDDGFRYYKKNKIQLYEAAFNYVEDVLQRLVDDIHEDTLIILIGDHGEAFWEHSEIDKDINTSWPVKGLGHGGTPFDEVARVPIGISDPINNDATMSGGWPSLVDLPRTICHRCVDQNDLFGGMDLADPIPEDRFCLCEAPRYGDERKAVYRGKHKIYYCKQNGIELTSTLSKDGEVFEQIPDNIRKELREYIPDSWDGAESAKHSRAVDRQLKALGYK